jgi:hypothetical protein
LFNFLFNLFNRKEKILSIKKKVKELNQKNEDFVFLFDNKKLILRRNNFTLLETKDLKRFAEDLELLLKVQHSEISKKEIKIATKEILPSKGEIKLEEQQKTLNSEIKNTDFNNINKDTHDKAEKTFKKADRNKVAKSIDFLKVHGLITQEDEEPINYLIDIIEEKVQIESYNLIREYYVRKEKLIYRIPEKKWHYIGNLLNKLEKRNIISVKDDMISLSDEGSRMMHVSEQNRDLLIINTKTPVKEKIQKTVEKIIYDYEKLLNTVEKIKPDEIFFITNKQNKFGVPYFRSNYDRVIRFLKNENFKIISDSSEFSRTLFSSEENREFYKSNPHLSKKIEKLENEEFREIPGFINNDRPYLISNLGRIISHDHLGDEFILKETDIAGGKYIGVLLNDSEGKHQLSLSKLIAFMFLKEKQLEKDLWAEFKLLDKNSRFSVTHKDGDPNNNSLENLEIIDNYDKFHLEKNLERQKFLETVKDEDEETFFLRRNPNSEIYCEGRAIYIPENNSMILMKGSIINTKENSTYTNVYGEDPKYKNVDENRKTTVNMKFSNPSIAGGFVTGNNSNGMLEWKNKNEVSIKEYYSLKGRKE